MPRTLPLTDVQPKFAEMLATMSPGEQVVITDEGRPIALITRPTRSSWPCQPGSARDRALRMDPDFDAPLEDFAEHTG